MSEATASLPSDAGEKSSITNDDPITKCPSYPGEKQCPICFRFANDDQKLTLSQLKRGRQDALECTILDICWRGQDYTIYRSTKGVYVHFSDCRELAYKQRRRFDAIGAKLCEVRYLTSRMGLARFGWRPGIPASYYDHQIVQAMVAALEGPDTHTDDGLLDSVLKMAVSRVTNENRVLYLVSCFGAAVAVLVLSLFAFRWSLRNGHEYAYVAAGAFGAVGAVFSIGMRVQSLELIPCHESFMNLVMGALRVFIGALSGVVLLLLLYTTTMHSVFDGLFNGTSITKLMDASSPPNAWMYVAILGIVGGFAERLVPSMLQSAGDKEPAAKV